MKTWCLLHACTCGVLVGLLSTQACADDWPMLGRDQTRNAVSSEKQPPLDWHLGEFDRKTRQAIWVGWASRRLSAKDDRAEVVNTAVGKILAPFPNHS